MPEVVTPVWLKRRIRREAFRTAGAMLGGQGCFLSWGSFIVVATGNLFPIFDLMVV